MWDEDEDVGERWREVGMGWGGAGGCDVDMRGDWVRRKEKRLVVGRDVRKHERRRWRAVPVSSSYSSFESLRGLCFSPKSVSSVVHRWGE
jgi:hypothetical protein